MPYTVTQLITGAYYTSGLVARELQDLQGSQLIDGLGYLNEILADKTVELGMVPYNLTYDFTAIQAQQTYFIPNLIQVSTMVFYLDSVRYPMTQIKRDEYFGSGRAENIQSLPFSYHVERCFGGANVYMYFLPDANYAMEIHGLFGLQAVVLNQDLSLTLDGFYISYLKFALAERICIENNYVIPNGVELQVRRYNQMISKRSQQLDLSGTIISTLGSGENTVSYAQVNLSPGWSPI